MNEKMSFNMDVQFAASSYVSIVFFLLYVTSRGERVLRGMGIQYSRINI